MLEIIKKISLLLFATISVFSCSQKSSGTEQNRGPNQTASHSEERLENPSRLEESATTCKGPVWTGSVNGKAVSWTEHDLRITTGGRASLQFRSSFLELHRAEAHEAKLNLSNLNQNGRGTNAVFKSTASFSLVSLVGPYATFQIQYGSFLDGYPGSNKTWWLPLDLSKDQVVNPFSKADVENVDIDSIADVRQIFASRELYEAITNNSQMGESFNGESGESNQIALRETLEHKNDDFQVRVNDQGDSLTNYSFEHFVFNRLDNDKISVLLALVSPAAYNTYEIKFIELLMPVPSQLREAVASATRRNNSFLAIDQKLVSGGCSTILEESTRISSKRTR